MLFYVPIPEDEKNFCALYPITLFFSEFCCFLQQDYSLWLGFRFGLSLDLVWYCLAPQRLSLKSQSKIEFQGPFSSHIPTPYLKGEMSLPKIRKKRGGG